MRVRQVQSVSVTPTFTVELWFRSRNTQENFPRTMFGFRDWSQTFPTAYNGGIELQTLGMKLDDNQYVDMYATQAIAQARPDMDATFKTTFGNSESLLMVTASYCTRVATSVNVGDCYVPNDIYIAYEAMAFCLTIRGGFNYSLCSAVTDRLSNTIDYSSWSLLNKFQFAPIFQSNSMRPPVSWTGDILFAAIYGQALNGSTQAQNFAAGLPNSNPTVPSICNMSAYEDTMNASCVYLLLLLFGGRSSCSGRYLH